MRIAYASERRLLQIAILLAVAVPLSAGFAGIVLGPGMIDSRTDIDPALISHFSYLSGLLLAIGMGFASCIPAIEVRTDRVRLLTFLVVLGGIGRLYALYKTEFADITIIAPLAMELLITPLLAMWQGSLARRAR